MNWKLLALIPFLTLATALPGYSQNNPKTHNTTSSSQLAQNHRTGDAMKKPNGDAMAKPNGDAMAKPNGDAMKKPTTEKKLNVVQKPKVVKKPNAVVKHSSVLTIGSKGEAVKNAQSFLKQQGFYTGTVNGVFDKQTRLAVIKFQKSKGLKADGIIGSRTLTAMK